MDDLSGWEGEGYDEAILPMDFLGEEVNALTAVMIRNVGEKNQDKIMIGKTAFWIIYCSHRLDNI